MTFVGATRPATPKWSQKEQWRLFAAVKVSGTQWKKVSEYLPGRSAQACQNRFFKMAPTRIKRRYEAEPIPDLTEVQIEQARRLRASGANGNLDWRTVAKLMGVAQVQIWRVFRPSEIERKRYVGSGAMRSSGATKVFPLIIPDRVLDERERAYAAVRTLTAELMGDPPPHRSALARKQQKSTPKEW